MGHSSLLYEPYETTSSDDVARQFRLLNIKAKNEKWRVVDEIY